MYDFGDLMVHLKNGTDIEIKDCIDIKCCDGVDWNEPRLRRQTAPGLKTNLYGMMGNFMHFHTKERSFGVQSDEILYFEYKRPEVVVIEKAPQSEQEVME